MTTMNQGWSAAPAPGSGHLAAAPPISRGKPDGPTPFTIDGQTPEQLRQQARERAQRASVPVPSNAADAFAAQQNAHKAFKAHLETVRANKDLTPQGTERAIAAFANSPVAQSVDQAHEIMQQHAAAAHANVDAVRNALTQPGDSAQEQRNTRIWNRVKAVLDNAEDGKVGVVAQQQISMADRPALGVLLEELGPYLQSRGVESDWLLQAFEQAVPELAQAQRAAGTAQQHADVIRYNTEALRRGFASGTVPPTLVDPSVVHG